jgi:hypothetical protein
MSTRNISWGKGGWCVGQTNYLHVPIFLISGSLNLLEPSGPVMGLLYHYLIQYPVFSLMMVIHALAKHVAVVASMIKSMY